MQVGLVGYFTRDLKLWLSDKLFINDESSMLALKPLHKKRFHICLKVAISKLLETESKWDLRLSLLGL